MHPLSPAVETLLREAAEAVVLPRFKALARDQIEEKQPGEIVTVADRECEDMLARGLSRLLPEAIVVGEEACAADPGLYARIDAPLVWLIDPIDGTANFAEGRTPFALMVALLEDGAAQASWIYDPVARRMCHASAGRGAFVDGEQVRARESGGARPLAELGMAFLSTERREDVQRRIAGRFDIAPFVRCAGDQYPRIALGVTDVALFERTLAWDHVPGALLVTEADGVVLRPDGSPYRAGDGRSGLIAACSERLWTFAAETLFG